MIFLVAAFILIAIALFFVLPPLFRKIESSDDQDDNDAIDATRQQIEDIDLALRDNLVAENEVESIKHEAQQTLTLELAEANNGDSKKEKSNTFFTITAICLCLFIPFSAFILYLLTAHPQALFTQANQVQVSQALENQNLDSIEVMLERLDERLKSNPDDLKGWQIKAKTSMVLQQYNEAVRAMKNVYRLTSDQPTTLADYAQALVMAAGGKFTDESLQLIEVALKIDENHVPSLWLNGQAALATGDYLKAQANFQKAKYNSQDTNERAQLDQMISLAKEQTSAINTDPTSANNSQQAASSQVIVEVTLDAKFTSEVKSTDTLFVFARAENGNVPLAASRHRVAELPLSVRLDDSMAMIPSMTLSSQDKVIITARISKSNQPIAASGDLQTTSPIINPSTNPRVKLNIDQVVK